MNENYFKDYLKHLKMEFVCLGASAQLANPDEDPSALIHICAGSRHQVDMLDFPSLISFNVFFCCCCCWLAA